jgi:hypothetical protein
MGFTATAPNPHRIKLNKAGRQASNREVALRAMVKVYRYNMVVVDEETAKCRQGAKG